MSRIRHIILVLGATLSFTFAACGDDDGECTTKCKYGGGAVKCYIPPNPIPQIVCSADNDLAAIHCSEAGGASAIPVEICVPESGETGEDPIPGTEPPEPWDPNQDVLFDYDSAEYVIDQSAFEALHDDISPLQSDMTRLVELDTGYYYVEAQGALSDALGWQPGDVLLSLNGYPLQGLAEISVAYTEIGHSTHFTLEVQREQSTVVLRYRVE